MFGRFLWILWISFWKRFFKYWNFKDHLFKLKKKSALFRHQKGIVLTVKLIYVKLQQMIHTFRFTPNWLVIQFEPITFCWFFVHLPVASIVVYVLLARLNVWSHFFLFFSNDWICRFIAISQMLPVTLIIISCAFFHIKLFRFLIHCLWKKKKRNKEISHAFENKNSSAVDTFDGW